MESADGFMASARDKMVTHSESPELDLPSPLEPSLEQYLYSSLFHPSLSPQLAIIPSMGGSPALDGGKVAKKRERKKQPKLECCTEEQIARRRAQNRRSQKAYRERREAQLQTLQDKIDEIELRNEKLQIAYESLRYEVVALRTGPIPALPKCDGSSGGLGPRSGQASPSDYLSFPDAYPVDGNQGLGWGLGS